MLRGFPAHYILMNPRHGFSKGGLRRIKVFRLYNSVTILHGTDRVVNFNLALRARCKADILERSSTVNAVTYSAGISNSYTSKALILDKAEKFWVDSANEITRRIHA